MLAFLCTHCNKPLRVNDELAGKKATCPACGKPVPVPAANPDLALMADAGKRSPVADPSAQREPERTLPEKGARAPSDVTDARTLPPENPSVITHSNDSVGNDTADETRAAGKHPPELTDFLGPPLAPDEIGRLGKYRILAVLGRGGMGVVFRAHDPLLDRVVALKAMLPGLAASQSAKERFFREAKAAAALKHAHVVTIFDVGEDRRAPFLAMEFLDGESLDDRIRRQPRLPTADILRIGKEMAEGLEVAHERGLIHRDIKPGNIWLEGAKGHVKILDFGLARAMREQTHLTQSGAIVGTPAYMAPEQAASKKVDHRCDLFSMGCVLYRMSTGERPFKGDDTLSIIAALALETPAPPAQLNPALPVELSDLIMRLLAKKPEDRPADAREVVEALLAITMQSVRPMVESLPTPVSVPLATAVETTVVDPWQAIDQSTLSAVVPTEMLTARTESAKTDKKRLGAPIWIALALGVLLVAGGAFAAYKLFLESKDGTLVVEVDGDADVRFRDGELQVYGADGALKYTLKPGERHKSMPPGNYTVSVAGAEGVKLDAGKFEMVKDGKVVLRVAAARSVAAKKEKQAPTEPEMKWMTLFDGKDLAHWTVVGTRPAPPFEVNKSEHVLVAKNGPICRLQSEKDYADFHLLLEFRIITPSARSGINIRMPEGATGILPALKIQIRDDPTPYPNSQTGGIYYSEKGWFKRQREDLLNPRGQWNRMDVFASGQRIRVLVNGKQAVDADLGTVKDKGPIPAALHPSGRIALCADIGEVWYRNIEIGPITAGSTNDPNRHAAKYVLSVGGMVRINDAPRDIRNAGDLPAGPFRLTYVLLASNLKVTDAGLEAFEGCTDLTDLNLIQTTVTDAGLAVFKDCKNLQTLSLSSTRVEDAGMAHFSGCKNLLRLELGTTKVGDAGMENFKDCKHLRDLQLSGTRVSDEGLANFKDCKELVNLGLSGPGISDVGVGNFVGCKELKNLSLQSVHVSDAGLASFKGSKRLIELKLNYTDITDSGLANFKDCADLALLDLTHTRVTGEGLADLKECKNLGRIDLIETRLNDPQLKNLKHFEKLGALNLIQTPLSDAGVVYIKECTSLRRLDVRRTKVTAAGIAELKRALPLCRIEWDGGVIEPAKDAGKSSDRKAAEYVLSIGGTVRVNDEGNDIKTVAGLPNGPFWLSAFSLDHSSRVNDAGLKNFQGCVSLSDIDLWQTPVTDAGLAVFKGSNLKRLSIGFTKVSDAGLAHFSECKKLANLNLGFTKVTNAGLAVFKNCKELTDLALMDTKVGDVGLGHFKDCRMLSSLALDRTQVTDAGLAVLKEFKQLRQLNLSETKVTDQGLASIKGCTNLTNIWLQKTNVTAAGVDELKQALPRCTIIWDGGTIKPAK